MAKTTGILKLLTKERDLIEKQLSGINAAISAFAGVYRGTGSTGKRRKLSAEARERIAAAQRKRWAKFKAAKKRAV